MNVKDNGGNTPLHYASAKKDKSCMDLLLECGGKLDVKNFAGQTPLDVTSKSFAALFELQRVVQTKQKEMSIDNSSQPKGGVKKGSPEAAEFTSTHLESANTINKSLFSSKTVNP